MIRTTIAIFVLLLAAVSGCTGRTPIPPGTILAAGTDQAFFHEVTTRAPPEAIWSLWSDTQSWKDWDTGLADAALDGPFAVGARGTITPRSGGSAGFEITAMDPGRSYTFETGLPGSKLVITRTIIATSPTVFRHDVAFEGATAGLMAGQMGRGFRADLPVAMEKLARLAEAAGETPAQALPD